MATTCGVLTQTGYPFAPEPAHTGCLQILFM